MNVPRNRSASRIHRAGLSLVVALAIAVPGAAAGDPGVSEPVETDAPVAGRPPSRIVVADMACRDGLCLAVWIDPWTTRGAEIWAARVAVDGDPLDPYGIRVATLSSAIEDPTDISVSADDQGFLVVWAAVPAPWPQSDDVFAVRVDRAGIVLDATPIPIANGPQAQRDVRVGSDGTSHLVMWVDFLPISIADRPLRAARVDADGTVLDPAGMLVSDTLCGNEAHNVAGGPGGFLVTWSGHVGPDDCTVFATRVTSEGVLLDTSPLNVGGTGASRRSGRRTLVAPDGPDFLVSWWASAAETRDLRLARVTGVGEVLDPGGVPISSDTSYPRLHSLALAADGPAVLWSGRPAELEPPSSGLQLSRVDRSFGWLDGGAFSLHEMFAGLEPAPTFGEGAVDGEGALAGAEGHLVALWSRHGGPHNRDAGILVAPIPAPGDPPEVPPALLISPANSQEEASVAFDGTGYLLAWTDHRVLPGGDSVGDVFVARFAEDGALRDGPVGLAADSLEARLPAVSCGLGDCLVTWRDDDVETHAVRAALLPSDLPLALPPDTPVVPDVSTTVAPASAALGGGHFVVWNDFHRGCEGALFAPGTGFGPTTSLPVGSGDFAVASSASRALAIGVGQQPFSTGRRPIHGVFVDDSGAPDERSVFRVGGDTWDVISKSPAVGSDGERFLVVWRQTEDTLDVPHADLRGTLVLASGLPAEPAGLRIAENCGVNAVPRVAWTGSHYLVTWDGHGETRGSESVVGVRVSSWGLLIDDEPFALSDAGGVPRDDAPAFLPSVAGADAPDDAGADHAMVAYSHARPDTPYRAVRVHSRALSFPDGCLIGGVPVPTGAADPDDPCRWCAPDAAADAWTVVPDGALCEDGDACTLPDRCVAGICQSGAVVVCDDGDPSTCGLCDPLVGCRHDAVDCDDDDPCTTDRCLDGDRCTNTPRMCDDSDPCTIDACEEGACVNVGRIEGCCDSDADCPPALRCEWSAHTCVPRPPDVVESDVLDSDVVDSDVVEADAGDAPDAVPSDAVPSDAVPSDAVPSDANPGDSIPRDANPGDSIPRDAVGSDAVGSDVAEADFIEADTGDEDTPAGDIDEVATPDGAAPGVPHDYEDVFAPSDAPPAAEGTAATTDIPSAPKPDGERAGDDAPFISIPEAHVEKDETDDAGSLNESRRSGGCASGDHSTSGGVGGGVSALFGLAVGLALRRRLWPRTVRRTPVPPG